MNADESEGDRHGKRIKNAHSFGAPSRTDASVRRCGAWPDRIVRPNETRKKSANSRRHGLPAAREISLQKTRPPHRSHSSKAANTHSCYQQYEACYLNAL